MFLSSSITSSHTPLNPFKSLLNIVGSLLKSKTEVVLQMPLFIDVVKASNENDFTINNLTDHTIEKHTYHFNNIQCFLKETSLDNLLISDVKIKHMELLREWLHKKIKNCKPDHSSRHLRMCRKACDYAVINEYLQHNPISGIKLKKTPPKEIISLTVYEVLKFENYHSETSGRKNIACKLFLYQCFTGISFMDIWNHILVEETITLSNDTKKEITWITSETGRGKTHKPYWAIFLQKAKDIYDSFNGEFPQLSNQQYNYCIKKIAKDLNITKHLTTHIGRKTFANLKRAEGYSLPAISGMLGSSEAVVRKHYVQAGREVILAEIERVEKLKAEQIKPIGLVI